MPYIASLVLMVACIIHAIRTGRNQIWVYVLIFLPLVGSIAYIVAEILPEFLNTPGSRRLAKGAAKALDPGKDLRARRQALEMADTIENRRLLAEEYLKAGQPDEAVSLYETALVGIHADDPALLIGLARAASANGDAAAAIAALDRLRAANPDYQSTEGHLIYARSLEAVGREDEALTEYEALTNYAPGEEARCRRALLLQKRGRIDEARAGFEEILKRAKHAAGRYRRSEQEWIEIARRFASA